ncbi:MAG: macro domain-containing protein, partial [Longimicrobiales bacterium]
RRGRDVPQGAGSDRRMITIVRGALAERRIAAVLRPVTAEWAAPTPAMRRLEVAAGPDVEERCRALGELPVGSAVVTPAGALPAELLVHVVVRSAAEPVTARGVEQALRNGLRRAAEWAVQSLALPPLGTGAGNLDPEQAAAVMMPVLIEHVRSGAQPKRIEIIVDGDYERDAFERELPSPGPQP